MWCWISIEWDFLRVAIFYGPVWMILLATFSIYAWVGKYLYEVHRQLRAMMKLDRESCQPQAIRNPPITPGITKTTEVKVTYEPNTIQIHNQRGNVLNKDQIRQSRYHEPQYTVQVQAEARNDSQYPKFQTPPSPRNPMGRSTKQQKRTVIANQRTVSYCKFALLFFVVQLVTWVPSSINRVYSLVHPNDVSYPLTFASSLVLPLQGFWNTAIYVATSLPACKTLARKILKSTGIN